MKLEKMDAFFAARLSGYDEHMLAALKRKFADRKMTLICGSYFDVPFEAKRFDAAVSVESLHHFTVAQKLKLYKKLNTALSDNGYFVLTDYFAESQEAEHLYFSELERLKSEQGLEPNAFYHYDTPLTVEHEMEVLRKATYTIFAYQ